MSNVFQSGSHNSTQVCTKCVMDTSAPEITFDKSGVCSYCREAEAKFPSVRLSPEYSEQRLKAAAEEIKSKRTSSGYDCVIGLSGGVDSSYMALLAHRLGLRPLAVHLDNGWNSEIAVANIRGLVEHCGLDLVTHVIDWHEFRDLQRSFFRAGVIDIELLSDHAIMAAIFNLCRQYDCQYILSGTHFTTEHGMPREWTWNKQDVTNIRAIHRRFGSIQLKTYPMMGLIQTLWKRHLGFGPKLVELLDLANYKKTQAIETLRQETGWRDYGGKHYESVFTKFYQAYVLPEKFGVDKRRPHLSALIRNNEITRDMALAALQNPLYAPDELRKDKEFIIKKLGFTEDEFDKIMRDSPVPHDRYLSDRPIRNLIKNIIRR